MLETINISVVDYDDKVRAVIECFLSSKRYFTIRELRKCANVKVSVSEKTISKILKDLYINKAVAYRYKKWYLVDYDFAKRFINGDETKNNKNELNFFYLQEDIAPLPMENSLTLSGNSSHR